MGKTKAKKGIGMIFKPAQLGLARLDAHELEEDKKACRKIGPCGVGKKALYLNSFYIDRRYYLPYGSRSSATSRTSGMWTPCWLCWPRSSRRSSG